MNHDIINAVTKNFQSETEMWHTGKYGPRPPKFHGVALGGDGAAGYELGNSAVRVHMPRGILTCHGGLGSLPGLLKTEAMLLEGKRLTKQGPFASVTVPLNLHNTGVCSCTAQA